MSCYQKMKAGYSHVETKNFSGQDEKRNTLHRQQSYKKRQE
ncbi:hypothetical protein HNR34_000871 [Geobacillus subterraneus]